MENNMKICKDCKIGKNALIDYQFQTRVCRQCRSAKYNKKRYDSEYFKNYYQLNREKIIANNTNAYYKKYKAIREAYLKQQQEAIKNMA